MSQPESLRLADAWDQAISTRRHVSIGCEMADELRRLITNPTQGRNMTETQRKALQAAEDAFRRYADHHAMKGDETKARANMALAGQMAAAQVEPTQVPLLTADEKLQIALSCNMRVRTGSGAIKYGTAIEQAVRKKAGL